MIYPNPSTNFLSIALEDGGLANGTFELRNSNGKVLLQAEILNKRFQVDLRTIPKGVYYCRIIHESSATATQKLILLGE
ncbi:MAG: T9SS type A sorting domain-containing protein [Bacteroidota bacterium]|nr:T9SS type A sorting domain-containing protein [Bacteroidota bacterium]